MAGARPTPVRLPDRSWTATGSRSARDRLRQPPGRLATRRVPRAGALPRGGHLPRHRDRRPHVTVVDGTDLSFLPDASFDVLHAHSVFSHTPLDVIEAYLAHARRLLRPGGFFDFTYNATDRAPWDFLREDYYYPTELLLRTAERHGLDARPLEDWEPAHKQSKIRATQPLGDDRATLTETTNDPGNR